MATNGQYRSPAPFESVCEVGKTRYRAVFGRPVGGRAWVEIIRSNKDGVTSVKVPIDLFKEWVEESIDEAFKGFFRKMMKEFRRP